MADDPKTTAWEYLKAGHLAAAADLFQKLADDDPDDADMLVGLGKTYELAGKPSLAVKSYKEAVGRDSSCFEANHRLGLLLLHHYGHNRSVKFLSRAVAIDQTSDVAWTDLGAAFNAGGNMEAAVKSWQRAIQANPATIAARFNMASYLREAGHPDKALSLLQEILKLEAHAIDARTLAASIYSDLNQVDEAIALLEAYLEDHPENADCRQTLALIQLRAGILNDGFKNYQARFFPSKGGVQARPHAQPEWQGEPLKDERLLVWLEQGLGDEIMALSLIGDIMNRAPVCSIECDARLVSLASRSFPTANVFKKSDPPAAEVKTASFATSALSTARFLRQEWTDFPQRSDYLAPDPEKVDALRKKYSAIAQGRQTIGLSWSSGAIGGRHKTPPLESWKAIFDDPDRLIVSIQYDPAADQIEALSNMGQSELYVDAEIDVTKDIDMAAAQIAALGRVVSISNTAAHLAGALGVPTAVLVPEGYGGFWYWHRHTRKSPWYPETVICRQSAQRRWEHAMAEAENWLRN